MNSDHHRAVLLRRTALACALLVLAVVGISAFIRLAAAGLGCTPWPACYGQVQAALPAGTVDAARLLHRVLAVALLPLILLLVAGGLVRKPAPWAHARLALLALALVLFLAVLGRWTAGAKVPAVALGNLLGGFVLFALCARMALPGPGAALSVRARRWRRIGVGALLLQAALGALLSSSLAGLSCPSLTDCALPSPIAWQALNPWQVPQLDPSTWPPNPGGALLHWLHRGLALLVAAAVLMTALQLLRCDRRRSGLVLLALLALQLALGVLLVLSGLPLALAVAHNLLAALLLATLLSVS